MAAAMVLAAPAVAQEWKSQYFYDQPKSSLVIQDLQFPSAQRGIAVGFILQGTHREPAAVITSDGGEHWELTHPGALPTSLFFLNEGLGWMVAGDDLWKTTEAGRSWTKVSKFPKGPILRVYFADADNGWAVGFKKTVLETHDGGAKWTPVATAAAPPGETAYSAYIWIAFATPKFGMIMGYNQPPRRWASQFPDWLDPQGAASHGDVPHLNYSLETRDGGKTWRSSSASLFGDTSRVRFLPDGTGIGLVEYSPYYRLASEVYTIDWRTGKSESIYKDTKFGVTDMWKMPDGTVYLAGTLPLGRLRNVVAGKVQVLTSRDYKTWLAMPVDYRATANRVTLAAPDDRDVWMATDSGMILKLVVPEIAVR
jgi:hypothetical protein